MNTNEIIEGGEQLCGALVGTALWHPATRMLEALRATAHHAPATQEHSSPADEVEAVINRLIEVRMLGNSGEWFAHHHDRIFDAVAVLLEDITATDWERPRQIEKDTLALARAVGGVSA